MFASPDKLILVGAGGIGTEFSHQIELNEQKALTGKKPER
jgi:hypothetical protein